MKPDDVSGIEFRVLTIINNADNDYIKLGSLLERFRVGKKRYEKTFLWLMEAIESLKAKNYIIEEDKFPTYGDNKVDRYYYSLTDDMFKRLNFGEPMPSNGPSVL